MRCLSCQAELKAATTRVFRTLVVCLPCHALAESAEIDIRRRIKQAELHALQYLEQHILRGGLLTPEGSPDDLEAALPRLRPPKAD